MQQITCSFTSKDLLYWAYMPFVIGGGLFIRTEKTYVLGALVNLTIKLMNEYDHYSVDAKVVWITPKGAQGNKMPGVGLQFLSENRSCLCNKIETYLAEMLKSQQVTDTI